MDQSNQGLKKFLNNIHEYGIAFLKEVPTNPQEVIKVANRFGLIRNTFYGETWDVKSVPNAENIAYTSMKLYYHQDLMFSFTLSFLAVFFCLCGPLLNTFFLKLKRYFEAPPGVQMLHSLVNTVSGGNTLFMDGYKAVEILKETDPRAYEVLCKVPVTFHYVRNNRHMHFRRPTINPNSLNEYIDLYYAPNFQVPSLILFPLASSNCKLQQSNIFFLVSRGFWISLLSMLRPSIRASRPSPISSTKARLPLRPG